ncbi:hypothetical protein JCM15831A_03940 [Asaia astilbis]
MRVDAAGNDSQYGRLHSSMCCFFRFGVVRYMMDVVRHRRSGKGKAKRQQQRTHHATSRGVAVKAKS